MSFADFAGHSAWVQLGLSLAHFLWQGAAIAMLLAMGLFVLRRRAPEVRHGLFSCRVRSGSPFHSTSGMPSRLALYSLFCILYSPPSHACPARS